MIGYVKAPDSCELPCDYATWQDMWDLGEEGSARLREAIADDNAHRGETLRERLSPRAVEAVEKYMGHIADDFLRSIPY
ncbi:MAG TPA: hypothetical protein PKB09_04065 [Candidatus Saccharibacteria bacterium]|nr:hypothetical protein [Candidatus Saccharibacteria bacterium]